MKRPADDREFAPYSSARALGDIVRARRTELGMSQEALARAVGATQGYISKIETGTSQALQVDLRHRLANALGLPLPSLLDMHDASEPHDASALAARLTQMAQIAREAGRPFEASEAARDAAALLPVQSLTERTATVRARALLVEGVALGDLVDAAADHPGLARLRAAYQLLDQVSDAHDVRHAVTLKLGNELRKTEQYAEAHTWLSRAVDAAPSPAARQMARIALIRTLDALRRPSEAASQVALLRAVEDVPDIWTPTLHPLAVAEVEARSLLSRRRSVRCDVLNRLQPAPGSSIAPQWELIGRLTHAEVLMSRREDDGAVQLLTSAIQQIDALAALPRLRDRGTALLARNRAIQADTRTECAR